MASVAGRVTEALDAVVTVRLVGGMAGDVEVECAVDTAFNGYLVLPRAIIDRLGMPILFHEKVVTVGGETSGADYTLAQVEWLGEVRRVEVIVKEDRLLGTALLAGARLTVDYAAGTVLIER